MVPCSGIVVTSLFVVFAGSSVLLPNSGVVVTVLGVVVAGTDVEVASSDVVVAVTVSGVVVASSGVVLAESCVVVTSSGVVVAGLVVVVFDVLLTCFVVNVASTVVVELNPSSTPIISTLSEPNIFSENIRDKGIEQISRNKVNSKKVGSNFIFLLFFVELLVNQ